MEEFYGHKKLETPTMDRNRSATQGRSISTA